LVANGRWRKNPFHLFPLSSQPILPKPSIFPFDLKVLFYRGSKSLFTRILPFPWLINYDHIFDVTSPPHIHCQFDFVKDFSSLPWNYGVTHGHILWAPSHASEWRTDSGVIFKFDVDVTSSWWRPCTASVATPLWPSVGVKPNTSKVGDLESSGTPECLEFNSKVQNTSHW
jgi:hypothetical protein